MKRWLTKPLGEVCDLVNGAPFKPSDWDGSGLPIIRIQNLNDPTKPFNYTSKNPAEKFRVRPGDTLLSWSGTPGTSFGCFRWDGPEGWLNQHIFNVHLNAEVLPPFFIYQVNSKLEELIGKAHGGVGLQHITKGALSSVKITVPPLADQDRIVKLLDEADDLRKLRSQADRHTTALIEAVFHKMFGDVQRNSKEWPIKVVGDLCDLVRGSSPRPKSDPRYYGGAIPRLMIEDITRDGWLVTPRVDSLTELGATMSRPVKAGTIVMAVSGNIGLCGQLAVDACIHDGFVAFKDLRADLVLPLFFGIAMSQMRQAHQRNQAGAIFQNITTTDVKAMVIPLPPLSLQGDFCQRVAEIRGLEGEQAVSRRRLDDLFQSMLHQAFEGDL
jgi:restriction endonuclease S subunit